MSRVYRYRVLGPAGADRRRETRDRRWRRSLAGRTESERVLEVARSSGLAEQLGPDPLLFNARAVIERYQAMQAGSRQPAARL